MSKTDGNNKLSNAITLHITVERNLYEVYYIRKISCHVIKIFIKQSQEITLRVPLVSLTEIFELG